MPVKKRKIVVVACPECGQERRMRADTARLIETGRASGLCRQCWLAANTLPAKVPITCPSCGNIREIDRKVYHYIQNKGRSGKCPPCAQVRGAGSKTAGSTPLSRELRGTRVYTIWTRMRNRCNDPNADNYKYYGGRGIYVCSRWDSFERFVEDMYPTYADGLTIERIDNDGPYSPENCRWATVAEQMGNRRMNRMITWDGRTQTIAAWSRELGMNYFALRSRLDRGMPPGEAFTAPVKTVSEVATLGARTRWGKR